MRIASKCEIELEEHTSAIVLGERRRDPDARLRRPRGRGARRRSRTPSRRDEELERLRILARTPRWGREIDDGILPAEAGLDERAVSFTKGCFPGQEPVARLHNRGHVNRALRVLEVEGDRAAPADEVRLGEEVVGRVTSSVPGLALAYVRAEVPGRRRARGRRPPSPDTLTTSRARSSGDRALPCGGRGRKFESCRAHPSVSPGESRASAGPPPFRLHRPPKS